MIRYLFVQFRCCANSLANLEQLASFAIRLEEVRNMAAQTNFHDGRVGDVYKSATVLIREHRLSILITLSRSKNCVSTIFQVFCAVCNNKIFELLNILNNLQL